MSVVCGSDCGDEVFAGLVRTPLELGGELVNVRLREGGGGPLHATRLAAHELVQHLALEAHAPLRVALFAARQPRLALALVLERAAIELELRVSKLVRGELHALTQARAIDVAQPEGE